MATRSSILPGRSHGQRSLVGYSPWVREESDHNWTCHGCSHVADHWTSRVKSQLKIIQQGFLKGTVKMWGRFRGITRTGNNGIVSFKLGHYLPQERHRWDISVKYCVLNHFSSVQSLSHVQLFTTPWIAECQASLSITNSRSSLRLTSIESVMLSSHLIVCRPLLLLPPIPPSIKVFSSESTLCMRWPKYWSFSFSIIPSKEIQGWSPSEWTGWISLQSKGLSRVFSNTTVQKHQFFGTQLSL